MKNSIKRRKRFMRIGYWRADAMHEDVVEEIMTMMMDGTLEENIIGQR